MNVILPQKNNKSAIFFIYFIAINLMSNISFSLQMETRTLKPRDSHLIFDANLMYKEIAITFSGSIQPEILEQSLKILSEEKIKAHFFISGLSSFQYPLLTNKVLSQGHILGSQGLGKKPNQKQFSSLQESIDYEIQAGHEYLYAVTGKIYPFVRLSPRHGGIATRQFIQENGVFAFYWNIDYQEKDAEQSIIESLKKENYRGIVSLSLTNKLTVPVLKRLIQELTEQDVKIIQILPPEEGLWMERPPLIRKSIFDEIQENGSWIQRYLKQQQNLI